MRAGRQARRLLALLLALAALLCLTACEGTEVEETPTPSPTPEPVDTPPPYVEPAGLALGYSSAGSLHPMEAADQGSLDIDSLVYEGLYRLDENFQPCPVLARDAWSDEEGLVWTVEVRDNVFFSDGTTLTAEHVASSLRAARTSGRYASRLSGITGVQAENDTVILTLAAPNGALTALLDVPVFLERQEGLPLGTGPYAFYGGEEGVSLHFNPAWWQGAEPGFTDVPLVSFDSLEDRAAAFGSGDVTVVTTDFNATGSPGWSGTYETHDYPTSVMLFVGFNAAEGRTCSDPLVRAALSRAFDRAAVVDILLAGHATVAALPVSPESTLYLEEEAAALDYDPAAAAELLEQAGWTKNDDGQLIRKRKKMSLTLATTRDSQVKQSIAARLAGELEKLGISVKVENLDWDSYTSALAEGRFDLYLGEVRLTGDFDISELVRGTLNYGAYRSETVEGSLDRYRAAAGTGRIAAAGELWRDFGEDPPFAVLCFKTNALLARWGMVVNFAPLQDHPFAGIENWTTFE